MLGVAVAGLGLGRAVPAQQPELPAGQPGPSVADAGPEVGGVRFGYDLYVGGARFMTGAATLAYGNPGYALEMSAQTVGLINLMGGYRYDFAANGVLDLSGEGPPVVPTEFVSVRTRNDRARTRTVRFEPDGTVATIDVPAPGRAPDLPAPHLLAGSVDPIAAAVWLAARIDSGEGCEVVLPVYDGRRRYDLVVADRGLRSLSVSGVQGYQGQAQLCTLRLSLIAGEFDDDGTGDERMRVMDIYFARPVAGGPVLPVRAEADSEVGALRLHMSRASAL